MIVFVCGRKRDVEIDPHDLKQVRKFQEFLGGEVHRCPICLHKPGKHPKVRGTCAGASGTCTCEGTREWVRQWKKK